MTVPPSPNRDTPLSVVLPPPELKPKRKPRVFRRMLLWVLVLAIVAGSIWTWVTVRFPYSNGEWTGYVQTLSHQGWVCKTWEGTLSTAALPGAAPEVTPFTIRSDSLAEALQRVTGQRVTLLYQQHRGIPSRCFGNTESYVTGFRIAE